MRNHQINLDVFWQTLAKSFFNKNLIGKPPSLLHFKSVDLAEQMTLLDAQLFMHLDSAELILWVQEQNEDKSPNLTKFTEHFNNMSYWCR